MIHTTIQNVDSRQHQPVETATDTIICGVYSFLKISCFARISLLGFAPLKVSRMMDSNPLFYRHKRISFRKWNRVAASQIEVSQQEYERKKISLDTPIIVSIRFCLKNSKHLYIYLNRATILYGSFDEDTPFSFCRFCFSPSDPSLRILLGSDTVRPNGSREPLCEI